MDEIWKDIPSYPGYQASNLGMVRSFYGKRAGQYRTEPRVLKPHAEKSKRMSIVLRGQGPEKRMAIHDIVLLSFIGPCPDLHEAIHVDGNVSNNALTNLRYITRFHIDGEVWKDIPDFAEYQVSNFGRVRSYMNKNRKTPKILKATLSSGYPRITITRDGIHYEMRVHKLVMLAFVGPCPEGTEIAHNNGNKKDNRPENLRYATRFENQLDRVKHGTNGKQFKLTESDVRFIKANHVSNSGRYGTTDIARLFGIKECSVYAIIYGRHWKHVL